MGYDKYCEHIEKKLPPKSNRRLAGVIDVENLRIIPGIDIEWQKAKLERKLRRLGLEPYEVQLLMSRAVEGASLPSIVKEQNWTSTGSANHHYKKALAKLRKMRFK